jgi:hypothetical protein
VVTSSTGTFSLGTLNVVDPLIARSVSGSIVVPETFAPGTGFDRGILFAVHGGMIVNAMNVNARLSGGTSRGEPPGGTLRIRFPSVLRHGGFWIVREPRDQGDSDSSICQLSTDDAAGIDLNLMMP